MHISNFKEYNDTNGYKRGDFVLQKTAEFLKTQEVMGVIPGRSYGATFLALFPGKDESQGRYLLDMFLKEFDGFSFYGEKKLVEGKMVAKVSISEYARESGKKFDEFFADFDTVSA